MPEEQNLFWCCYHTTQRRSRGIFFLSFSLNKELIWFIFSLLFMIPFFSCVSYKAWDGRGNCDWWFSKDVEFVVVCSKAARWQHVARNTVLYSGGILSYVTVKNQSSHSNLAWPANLTALWRFFLLACGVIHLVTCEGLGECKIRLPGMCAPLNKTPRTKQIKTVVFAENSYIFRIKPLAQALVDEVD